MFGNKEGETDRSRERIKLVYYCIQSGCLYFRTLWFIFPSGVHIKLHHDTQGELCIQILSPVMSVKGTLAAAPPSIITVLSNCFAYS